MISHRSNFVSLFQTFFFQIWVQIFGSLKLTETFIFALCTTIYDKYLKHYQIPLTSLLECAIDNDANASLVGFYRYLSALRPEMYSIDTKLATYELYFLSLKYKMLSNLAKLCPAYHTSQLETFGIIFAARVKKIDQLMEKCLDGTQTRVPQVIILGAGYDTRAYRFSQLRDQYGIRFIEIDQSSVQQRKLRLLKRNLGVEEFDKITTGIEYIECNFEHPKALRDALLNSKTFDASVDTFVCMEGVTYYLEIEDIRNSLQTLTVLRNESNESPEWYLVFDFCDENVFNQKATDLQSMIVASLCTKSCKFKTGLPLSKQLLNEFLKPHKIQIVNFWYFIELIGQMFPRISKVDIGIPQGLVECRWK